MKKFAVVIVCFITCLMLCNFNASAQKTTIWLVRHAEKADNQGDDPTLNNAGQHRANDLLKSLKHEHINAIFVTSYKRTALTAKPLADKMGITPQVYNQTDYTAFVNKITDEYKGKNVLIVGHSNTIVPIISALGCRRPFETLGDDDYDMLFCVTINKDNKPELEVSYYGESHHVTQLPEREQQVHPFVKPVTNY